MIRTFLTMLEVRLDDPVLVFQTYPVFPFDAQPLYELEANLPRSGGLG